MSDDDEWITVTQAAKRLGLSTETIRRRVDDNELRGRWTLPGKRGRRRVSAASVEEYLRKIKSEDPQN